MLALLLTDQFVPLALALIAPNAVNILLFHAVSAGRDLCGAATRRSRASEQFSLTACAGNAERTSACAANR